MLPYDGHGVKELTQQRDFLYAHALSIAQDIHTHTHTQKKFGRRGGGVGKKVEKRLLLFQWFEVQLVLVLKLCEH